MPAQPESLGSTALVSAVCLCAAPEAVVALGPCVEELALAAGASMVWGAPRGSPSEEAAVALGEAMVAELEEASALEEESAVALDLVVELDLVVAMGELDSLCVPLAVSKRSPSTRASSPL